MPEPVRVRRRARAMGHFRRHRNHPTPAASTTSMTVTIVSRSATGAIEPGTTAMRIGMPMIEAGYRLGREMSNWTLVDLTFGLLQAERAFWPFAFAALAGAAAVCSRGSAYASTSTSQRSGPVIPLSRA